MRDFGLKATLAAVAAVMTVAAGAKPAFAGSTAQPFTCGSAIQATVITAPDDKKFGIGTSTKAIEVVSAGGSGSGGMDLVFTGTAFFSIGFFFRDTNSAAQFVNTRFCFHDRSGPFVVEKQLNTYRTQPYQGGWKEAMATSKEFGSQRVFQATLDRIVVQMDAGATPANITLGGISLQQRPDRSTVLIMSDEGCGPTEACFAK